MELLSILCTLQHSKFSLNAFIHILGKTLALFTPLQILPILTYFESMTRVQAYILYKRGSFILLLPAAVKWHQKKAKTDKVCSHLQSPFLLITTSTKINKNGILNLLFYLSGHLKKDYTKHCLFILP